MMKIILILVCTGFCFTVFAQTSPEVLKEKYEANKRDVKVVTEYANALKEANMKQEAEAVTKEYMARCPALQVEDKDTYLLINPYVFGDPYSNVFEYGIYAVKKMKWDRVEKKVEDDKQARLMSLFKGMGSGVSGGDEIDKRYEVLMVLSKNLNKEINKYCSPEYKEEKYVMPVYDSARIERLTYLVSKGELLGQDGMRVKLQLADAVQAKDWSRAVQNLCVAADLNITEVRGSYVVAMLNILTREKINKTDIQMALALVQRLSDQEEQTGGVTNYYNILGRLYHLNGDAVNGDKYTRMGDAIEAEKMARFGDLMKAFNE